jgi:programmed cell death protein 5
MINQEKELEELRKRRLMESQQKILQQSKHDDAQKEFDQKKQVILRKILTSKARQRLANLKMVKADFAANLELQIIQIAQQGSVRLPINDAQLKEILKKLQANKREIRIRRV